MSNFARIVVISPARNEERLLPAAIASMVAQTLKPVQWVIVDDGSTDRSPAIADEFCDEDGRFKCIHLSRNFGHQAAVTAGLEARYRWLVEAGLRASTVGDRALDDLLADMLWLRARFDVGLESTDSDPPPDLQAEAET